MLQNVYSEGKLFLISPFNDLHRHFKLENYKIKNLMQISLYLNFFTQ